MGRILGYDAPRRTIRGFAMEGVTTMPLLLALWVLWTYVAWLVILDSEHPWLPQRILWCLAQLVLPFFGWPVYLLFGTGYLARMDAVLWPHRHVTSPQN